MLERSLTGEGEEGGVKLLSAYRRNNTCTGTLSSASCLVVDVL